MALLADLVVGIDHVGVCVRDVDAGAALWSDLLGIAATDREDIAPQRTGAAFIRPQKAGCAIELICPLPGNAGLEKFLDRRGETLHHVAFAVTDLAEALARLKAAGVPLIDDVPRPGAGGHQVAFLHPKALNGSLVELVERSTGH